MIYVKPQYEAAEADKFEVRVVYAGTAEGEEATIYSKLESGSTLTLTAKELEGMEFCFWTENPDEGVVLGTDKSYSMAVRQDKTIYAVYGNEGAHIEDKPVIIMTDIYRTQTGSKNRISFSATRNVSSNYTVVEQGMLYSTYKEITEEAMILGGPNVFKYTDSSCENSGVFTLNINVGMFTKTPVSARGYMIVKNNKTGNVETFYTDKGSASFDEN